MRDRLLINENNMQIREEEIPEKSDIYYRIIFFNAVISYKSEQFFSAFDFSCILLRDVYSYSEEIRHNFIIFLNELTTQFIVKASDALMENNFEKSKKLLTCYKTINEKISIAFLDREDNFISVRKDNIHLTEIINLLCDWKLIQPLVNTNPLKAFQRISQILVELYNIPNCVFLAERCEPIEQQLISLSLKVEEIDLFFAIKHYQLLINALKEFQKNQITNTITLEFFTLQLLKTNIKILNYTCEQTIDQSLETQLIMINLLMKVINDVMQINIKKVNIINPHLFQIIYQDILQVFEKIKNIYRFEEIAMPFINTSQQTQSSLSSLSNHPNQIFFSRKRKFHGLTTENTTRKKDHEEPIVPSQKLQKSRAGTN